MKKITSGFICPICGSLLNINEKYYSCNNNHNFDISKNGYINLLLTQEIKTKIHGDDKLMLTSRHNFLKKGYFKPLLNGIITQINKYAKNNIRILDSGCGECYYISEINQYLINNNISSEIMAIDISKDALSIGMKKNNGIEAAVASIYNMPIKENSIDIIINLFAPHSAIEFARILKSGGILIKAVPLENHLWSLKKVIYDNPYKNEPVKIEMNGFIIHDNIEIKSTICLPCLEDINNLFTMTPYYYKTSPQDKEKLLLLSSLNVEIEFGLSIYKKL